MNGYGNEFKCDRCPTNVPDGQGNYTHDGDRLCQRCIKRVPVSERVDV